MNKRNLLALVAATLLAGACASTTTPVPSVATPRGDDRFLTDPRIGFPPASPQLNTRFETAWRFFLAGNYAESSRLLAEIRTRNPEYLPAALAEAAVEMKTGNLGAARTIVQRVEDQARDYTTARVYEAEIDLADNRTRDAYDIYRSLAGQPGAPPTVLERRTELERRVFEELVTAAQTASDEDAARLLRQALEVNAGALNARVQLANRLIARRSFDEARQVLAPIASSPDFEKPEVQEAFAEVEAGRGQYQEAMARYNRLLRTNRDDRYARRLEEIKQQWTAANMPPQYQRAFESEAINRSDLAVLIYWKLTSVRFAQNLNSPPIAIDIEGVPGRDEMVRALAVGLYDVDPVTRRVSPMRSVNAASLQRLAARLLQIRGASCARAIPAERDEASRAEKVLAACSVTNPVADVPGDTPVSGRATATMLDDLEKALAR